MRVVYVDDVKSPHYHELNVDEDKMQYNTLGRSNKTASSSSMTNWFSSLRRTPKRAKPPPRAEQVSRSAWDLTTLERGVRRAVGWDVKDQRESFTFIKAKKFVRKSGTEQFSFWK